MMKMSYCDRTMVVINFKIYFQFPAIIYLEDSRNHFTLRRTAWTHLLLFNNCGQEKLS